MIKVAGIDYGSKLAGTTAIAYSSGKQITIVQSARKQDADQFLFEWAQTWKPTHLFLDAPLSLPGIYQKMNRYEDYFYRKADRQLKAMSPMFLGGLTARAMRLKAQFLKEGIEVSEVYPAHLAKVLGFSREHYKKGKEHLPSLTAQLLAHLPYPAPEPLPSSWHQFDALLALTSGYRYVNEQHLLFGDEPEGVIIV